MATVLGSASLQNLDVVSALIVGDFRANSGASVNAANSASYNHNIDAPSQNLLNADPMWGSAMSLKMSSGLYDGVTPLVGDTIECLGDAGCPNTFPRSVVALDGEVYTPPVQPQGQNSGTVVKGFIALGTMDVGPQIPGNEVPVTTGEGQGFSNFEPTYGIPTWSAGAGGFHPNIVPPIGPPSQPWDLTTGANRGEDNRKDDIFYPLVNEGGGTWRLPNNVSSVRISPTSNISRIVFQSDGFVEANPGAGLSELPATVDYDRVNVGSSLQNRPEEGTWLHIINESPYDVEISNIIACGLENTTGNLAYKRLGLQGPYNRLVDSVNTAGFPGLDLPTLGEPTTYTMPPTVYPACWLPVAGYSSWQDSLQAGTGPVYGVRSSAESASFPGPQYYGVDPACQTFYSNAGPIIIPDSMTVQTSDPPNITFLGDPLVNDLGKHTTLWLPGTRTMARYNAMNGPAKVNMDPPPPKTDPAGDDVPINQFDPLAPSGGDAQVASQGYGQRLTNELFCRYMADTQTFRQRMIARTNSAIPIQNRQPENLVLNPVSPNPGTAQAILGNPPNSNAGAPTGGFVVLGYQKNGITNVKGP